MKIICVGTGVLAVAVILGGCLGREGDKKQAAKPQPPAEPLVQPVVGPHPGPIMQRKLLHAQKLLRSITREDFGSIRAETRALSALSGEADWKVHQTLTYLLLSDQFKAVCNDMERHAKQKQVEAITLDYMHMVLTCVKCHRHMRHEGLAINDQALWETWAAVSADRPLIKAD